MATDVSIRVGVDGEAEFRAALTGINSQIRNLNSEMKSVVSGFTGMDSAEKKAAQQTEVLGRKMDVTKQKISVLTAEYDRQKAKLNQLGAELDQLVNAQNRDEAAITKATNAYNRQQTEVNNLGRQINDATADMNRMEREMDDIANGADDVGNALDDAGRQAADFGDVLKANLLGTAISNGLRVLADGIKSAFSIGMNYNSSIETYTTSFEVMTGSAEKAAETVEKLSQIAANTPFEMPDLANVTQLLMNYGFTADEAIDRMNMLGDISQGNAEKMNRIATAYGQMSSAGKVQLEDIKQMIEAGFNPLQEISESTGESMASLYDRISDGAVAVDEITQSMKRATSEGGRYFQSMEKQSETFSGQLSTLKDNVNSALGETFSGITTTLADRVLPKLNDAISQIDLSGISEKIEDAFNWLIDNSGTIVSDAGKIASAFAGVGVVVGAIKIKNVATDLLGVVSAALSGMQALTAYTTATKAATVAQAALSAAMSLTPLGLLATGLAAVVAGLAIYVNATDESAEADRAAKEAHDDLTRSIDARAESIDSLNKSAQDQINTSMSELDMVEAQIGEFNSLVDANGKVKAGYEDRAAVLADLINSKIPGAISKTEEESGAYYELTDAIQEAINQKRAQAILDAKQESYNQATANLIQAEKERYQIQQEINDAQARYNELAAEQKTLSEDMYHNDGRLAEIADEMQALNTQIEESKAKFAEADASVQSYYDTISEYEGLMEAMQQGGETLSQAITEVQYSFQTAGTASIAELQAQKEELYAIYQDMLARSQEEGSNITQTQIDTIRGLWEQANAEVSTATQNLLNTWTASLTAGAPNLDAAMQLIAMGVVSASDISAQMQEKGFTATSQFAAGIAAAQDIAAGNASQVEAVAAAALAGDTSQYGYDFMQGYLNAILATNPSPSVAAMVQEALAAIPATQQSGSPSRITQGYGNDFTAGYAAGISGTAGDAQSAASNMVSSVLASLAGKGGQAQQDGAEVSSGYAQGVQQNAGEAEAEADSLTNQALAKITASVPMMMSAGQAAASAVASGMRAAYSAMVAAGSYLCQGMSVGISGGRSGVVATARSVAAAAAAAVRAELQIASPSKVTEQYGKWFDEGFSKGVIGGKNSVVRTVAGLAVSLIGVMSSSGENAEKVAIRTSRKLGDALLDEQDKLNKQLAELDQRARDRQAAKELADYEEKIKKKYEELEKAEVSERKKIQDEISRMEEEWRDDQLKEQLDAQLDILETFTKEYEDALGEIESAQESMADKLRDYGELFETVKTETREFLQLGDLEDDIAAIQRYGEALEQLKARGVSDSLMDEVLGMSVDDATAYTEKLLNMTDDQYTEYMALWEQKQEEAQKIAEKFYQDEMDALQEEFVDKIPDELGEVKDEMRTIGVDGIQGMIDGMYSRSGALWSAASSIVSQAIAAMRAAADIHSPSKKVAEMVGVPMGEGVAVGMMQGIKASRRAIDAAIMQPISQVRPDDVYNAAAGAVTGITSMGGASTQTIVIPVNLNGKQIAEVIYDPLRQVGKQRGVAFG